MEKELESEAGGEVEEETRNSRSGGKTKLVEESIAEIDEVGSMAP